MSAAAVMIARKVRMEIVSLIKNPTDATVAIMLFSVANRICELPPR
jgi:hypothetical protein